MASAQVVSFLCTGLGIPMCMLPRRCSKRHRTSSQSQPQSPQQQFSTWNMIPTAVLHEMISYFDLSDLLTLEHVNATWQHVLSTAGVWQHIRLSHSRDHPANDQLLKTIAIRHGDQVKTIEMTDYLVDESVFVQFGDRFTQLEQFRLSGTKFMTDAAMMAIFRGSAATLTDIRVVGCPLITDTTLEAIAFSDPRVLIRFDGSHCRLLTGEGIAMLAAKCPQLEILGFKGCPKVNDAAIVSLATHCHALRVLAVGGGRDISDLSLRALATHCPHLQMLDVARSNPFGLGRGGVTDAGLLELVSHCRNIQSLGLRGQGNLSLAVLASLSMHCSSLKSLDIGGCIGIVEDPLALCAELKRMAYLERLSVVFCRGLKDEHLSSIATECPQLKKLEFETERN